MPVSIVIPSHNHLEDALKPCLQSIAAFCDINNLEVIVVANGCTDGTEQYVQSLGWPQLRCLSFPQAMGPGQAANAGIIASHGDYLLRLDNDIVLLGQNQNYLINLLLQPMLNDPSIGAMGISKLYDANSKHDFLLGFCAMFRREALAMAGIYSNQIEIGADVELCIRIYKSGFKVLALNPDHVWWRGSDWVSSRYFIFTPIWHPSGTTIARRPDFQEVTTRSRKILRDNYLQPTQYSIIVLVRPETSFEDFVARFHEITPYEKSEIIFVFQSTDTNNIDLFRGKESTFNAISNFGPYQMVEVDPATSEDDAVLLALKQATASRVVILDTQTKLTGPKGQWLDKLYN